jgi:hypothetical protein
MAIIGGKKELMDYMLKTVGVPLCDHMATELYEAINFFLNQYYSEWTPQFYTRTEEFLRSAFKTTPKIVGNTVIAEIGIDYESLYNYKDVTGFEVVSWANQGLHGGLDVGTDTRVWDDTIESTITSGQLLKDCIIYLKSRGINISK